MTVRNISHKTSSCARPAQTHRISSSSLLNNSLPPKHPSKPPSPLTPNPQQHFSSLLHNCIIPPMTLPHPARYVRHAQRSMEYLSIRLAGIASLSLSGPAYPMLCLPTRAQSASVSFGRNGNVKLEGRKEGSVAVMVADIQPVDVYIRIPVGAEP
jgi:hypothetical protein